MDGFARARQPHRAKVKFPVGGKAGERLDAFRLRQQHRVAKMIAARLIGEHVRQENALVDLQPILVALFLRCFLREIFARRHKARKKVRGGEAERVEAQELFAFIRQLVVERDCMRAEEGLSGFTRRGKDNFGGSLLGRRAPRFCGQFREQRLRQHPEIGVAAAVLRIARDACSGAHLAIPKHRSPKTPRHAAVRRR